MLFSILAITSFLFLLGGNLVGAGRIVAYIFNLDEIPGIWITTLAIWLYTIAGGLISVAYTDVGQALIGWTGPAALTLQAHMSMPMGVGPTHT